MLGRVRNLGKTRIAAVCAIAAMAMAAATVQASASGERAPAPKVLVYKLEGPLAGTPGKTVIFLYVKKFPTGKVKPLYVGAMFGTEVTYACDQGPLPDRSFSTQNDFRVNKAGKFNYSFSSFKASFSGKVTQKGKRVTGTISYGPGNSNTEETPNGEEYTNCSLPGSPISYTAKFKGIDT